MDKSLRVPKRRNSCKEETQGPLKMNFVNSVLLKTRSAYTCFLLPKKTILF